MEKQIPKYRLEIQRMMYIHGELASPLTETTDLVEKIIQDQLTEIIQRATEIAARRSSRSICPVDILFIIRHNQDKVSRVQRFLRWKEIRKSAKGGTDEEAATIEDEYLTKEEILGRPAEPSNSQRQIGNAPLTLPGSTYNFLHEMVIKPGADGLESSSALSAAYRQHLEEADQRTQNMTGAEYLQWSECRHASFTQGRKKRFREWIGLPRITHLPLQEDTFEVLGLLAADAVENLTKEALRVKQSPRAQAVNQIKNSSTEERPKDQSTPFALKSEEHVDRAPLQVRHIREALQRLQVNPRQKVANLLSNRRVEPQLPRTLI